MDFHQRRQQDKKLYTTSPAIFWAVSVSASPHQMTTSLQAIQSMFMHLYPCTTAATLSVSVYETYLGPSTISSTPWSDLNGANPTKPKPGEAGLSGDRSWCKLGLKRALTLRTQGQVGYEGCKQDQLAGNEVFRYLMRQSRKLLSGSSGLWCSPMTAAMVRSESGAPPSELKRSPRS